MNYLLDTNILIYLYVGQYNLLSNKQESVLADKNNIFFVSEASFFEMAIKSRLEKNSFSNIDIVEVEKFVQIQGIKLLKSKKEYYLNIVHVPKVLISANKLHADPFDLLIISQALTEKMSILSTDRYFPEYEGLEVVS